MNIMFFNKSRDRMKRKSFPLYRLYDDNNSVEAIRVADSPGDLEHFIAKSPATAFIALNEFLESYRISQDDSILKDDDNPYTNVRWSTSLRDFIMDNGNTVNKRIGEFLEDNKVYLYSHTNTLYKIVYDSTFSVESSYYNIDVSSSRYYFFPEFGVNADILFSVPDYINAAIAYYKGNKSKIVSVEHEFMNIIVRQFRSLDTSMASSEGYVFTGLSELGSIMRSGFTSFSDKTLIRADNFFFKYKNHECFDASTAIFTMAKRYFVFDVFERYHRVDSTIDIDNYLLVFLGNDNNFLGKKMSVIVDDYFGQALK